MSRAMLHVIKLAALLHDPAWKPWVVSSAFGNRVGERIGRVIAFVKDKSAPAGEAIGECSKIIEKLKQRGEYSTDAKAHEVEAAAAAYYVFGQTEGLARAVENEILSGGIVGEADRLAASLDRWILQYKEAKDVHVETDKVRYANPLDPRFKVEVEQSISPEAVCKYLEELHRLYAENSKLPLPVTYNLFYLLLEPLWYKNCSGCVPLADTRTPTHTVFDHVYAVASMTNWLLGGGDKPAGFLVKIDVAGIQEFISAARKTRDLWSGSWLVSALAWYTVAEAVMLLGGDIVLSPYTPANPFFIATLLKELVLQEKSDLVSHIEGILREAYLWKGAANQPIVPGTFFLALPCLDDGLYDELRKYVRALRTVDASNSVEMLLEALHECSVTKLRKYFIERFREGWQRVWNKVVENAVSSASNDLIKALADKLSPCSNFDVEAVSKYLKVSRQEPPLQVRVVIVNVEKEYKELLRWLGRYEKRLKQLGVRVDDIARKLLFTWLFTRALPTEERELLAKTVSISVGYRIGRTLEFVTSRTKGATYHECSMCSRLPAIIHIAQNHDCLSDIRPGTLFAEGESLCPYCLIRRLLTARDVPESVMDSLNLYFNIKMARHIYPRLPSTDELAVMDRLLEMVDRLGSDSELRDRLALILEGMEPKDCDRERDYVYLSSVVVRYAEHKLGKTTAQTVLDLIEKLYCKIAKRGSELPYLMASRMVSSKERCNNILGEDAKNLCKLLRERIGRQAGRYYAIIRGDGDFFGKRIVRGILDYASAEDYVDEVLSSIKDDGVRKRLRELLRDFVRELASIAADIADTPSKHTVKPSTLLTPAYYTALSRGQMITALYDAEIVTALAGFPVYAGGDDVAALTPGYISPERLRGHIEAYKDTAASSIAKLLAHHIRSELFSAGAVPGLVVFLTRRNYWALLGDKPGFHSTPIGALYPAPVAYGRSYGVYIVHYRDPFMAAWRSAGELEELKDTVIYINTRTRNKLEKDMVFMSYGRVSGIAKTLCQAVALPNLASRIVEYKATLSGICRVAAPILEALMVVSLIEEENKLSRSLYNDFRSECRMAEQLASKMYTAYISSHGSLEHYTRIAEKLSRMLVVRNARDTMAGQELASRLVNYSALIPLVENDLKGVLECKAPLSWMIVLSARILSSGRR